MSYWRLQLLFFSAVLCFWIIVSYVLHTAHTQSTFHQSKREFQEILERKNRLMSMVPQAHGAMNHPVRTQMLKALVEPWSSDLIKSLSQSRKASEKVLQRVPLQQGISVYIGRSGRLMKHSGEPLDAVLGEGWARTFFLSLKVGGEVLARRLAELFNYAGSREDFFSTAGEFRSLYKQGRHYLRYFSSSNQWQVLILIRLKALDRQTLVQSILQMVAKADKHVHPHKAGDVFEFNSRAIQVSQNSPGLLWKQITYSFLQNLQSMWPLHLCFFLFTLGLYKLGGYLLLATRFEFRYSAFILFFSVCTACILYLFSQNLQSRLNWNQRHQLSENALLIRKRLKSLFEQQIQNQASTLRQSATCELRLSTKGRYHFHGHCSKFSREVLVAAGHRLSRFEKAADQAWLQELEHRSGSLRTRLMSQLPPSFTSSGQWHPIRLTRHSYAVSARKENGQLQLLSMPLPRFFQSVFASPDLQTFLKKNHLSLLNDAKRMLATGVQYPKGTLSRLLPTLPMRASHHIPVQLDGFRGVLSEHPGHQPFDFKILILQSTSSWLDRQNRLQQILAIGLTLWVLFMVVPLFLSFGCLNPWVHGIRRLIHDWQQNQLQSKSCSMPALETLYQNLAGEYRENKQSLQNLHPVYQNLELHDEPFDALHLRIQDENPDCTESITRITQRYEGIYIPQSDHIRILIPVRNLPRETGKAIEAALECLQASPCQSMAATLEYVDSTRVQLFGKQRKNLIWMAEPISSLPFQPGRVVLQNQLKACVQSQYSLHTNSEYCWLQP